MDRSNLKERAADISKTANILSDELTLRRLPEPSFKHGLPAPLHSDAPNSNAGAARQKLLQMLDEYRALLTEPTLLLTPELASLFERDYFACNLLTITQPAQPGDECALRYPPGHRGELSTSGYHSPRSCEQAQPPREHSKASTCSLRNVSHLLPDVSQLFRAHSGIQSARGERWHA